VRVSHDILQLVGPRVSVIDNISGIGSVWRCFRNAFESDHRLEGLM